ncbi:hypothetical protein [Flindersiella endophytica]
MWIAVIFFAIFAILAAGSFWESRRKRAIYGIRAGSPADADQLGYDSGSVYGHGSWHGGVADAGSGSFGDCGSGGGGGDGGGSC